MIHELKCWPEYFKHVLDGTKLFELRVDDRNYQVGDTLRQREYEPGGRYVDGNPENGLVTKQGYSGREISHEVTYTLRNVDFLATNIVAMSLSPLPNASPTPGLTREQIENIKDRNQIVQGDISPYALGQLCDMALESLKAPALESQLKQAIEIGSKAMMAEAWPGAMDSHPENVKWRKQKLENVMLKALAAIKAVCLVCSDNLNGEPCPSCTGKPGPADCRYCKGTGFDKGGPPSTHNYCPYCHGTGKYPSQPEADLPQRPERLADKTRTFNIGSKETPDLNAACCVHLEEFLDEMGVEKASAVTVQITVHNLESLPPSKAVCPECKGKGMVPHQDAEYRGKGWGTRCESCQGTGKPAVTEEKP